MLRSVFFNGGSPRTDLFESSSRISSLFQQSFHSIIDLTFKRAGQEKKEFYCTRLRIPEITHHSYTPEKQSLPYRETPKRFPWKQNPSFLSSQQASKGDYANCFAEKGITKGHLRPAGDAKSKKEREKTFVYTNCFPQYALCNQGIWLKLEEQVRDLGQRHFVEAISGTLFLPKQKSCGEWSVEYPVIGKDPSKKPIAIPTHLFKVVLWLEGEPGKETLHKRAWVIPNKPEKIPLKTLPLYETPLKKIESWLGGEFNWKGKKE